MALQPSLRPLIIAGSHDAPHTLDIFRKAINRSIWNRLTQRYISVDYVCPFR